MPYKIPTNRPPLAAWWNTRLNYFGLGALVPFFFYFVYLNSLPLTIGSSNPRCRYLAGGFHQIVELASLLLCVFVIVTGIINIYLFAKKSSYLKIFYTLSITSIVLLLVLDQLGSVGMGCWVAAAK